MKLLITEEWLRKKLKEDEESGIDEPYYIGPPGPEQNKCPKCGLELHPVMGYVCPAGGDCPIGLGGSSTC